MSLGIHFTKQFTGISTENLVNCLIFSPHQTVWRFTHVCSLHKESIRSTSVSDVSQINVRVTTMDAELEFAIQPNTTGKQLFDQVRPGDPAGK